MCAARAIPAARGCEQQRAGGSFQDVLRERSGRPKVKSRVPELIVFSGSSCRSVWRRSWEDVLPNPMWRGHIQPPLQPQMPGPRDEPRPRLLLSALTPPLRARVWGPLGSPRDGGEDGQHVSRAGRPGGRRPPQRRVGARAGAGAPLGSQVPLRGQSRTGRGRGAQAARAAGLGLFGAGRQQKPEAGRWGRRFR